MEARAICNESRYTNSMNKKVILVFATIFSIIGGYVPVLLGDTNMLDGWTILSSTVGGIIGIVVGAYVSDRWG